MLTGYLLEIEGCTEEEVVGEIMIEVKCGRVECQ